MRVLAFVLCLLWTASANAWTPCDRSFHYLGMRTGDTTVISFWETTWGECDQHALHRVLIPKVRGVARDSVSTESPGKAFTDLSPRDDFDDHLMRMRWADSVFTGPFTVTRTYAIRPPVFDSAFNRVWRDSIRVTSLAGGPVERFFQDTAWLSQHVDEPTFERPVELEYRYPRGLYKNYRITDVLELNGFYFILTSQPLVTSSTFDGVLIYRFRR